MFRFCFILSVITLSVSGTAFAKENVAGEYLCTVLEKAGIASIHLEGSGPPQAFIAEETPTRFKMKIAPSVVSADRFTAVELYYDGADRDQRDWHTANSILHSEYSGDGHNFDAKDDQAFLSFYGSESFGYKFYHAGFEYPGGEDVTLSVRWGGCDKLK